MSTNINYERKNILKNRTTIMQICYGALFIALGLLLPRLFPTQELGRLFTPMHIPVILSGIICAPYLGAIIGFSLPLLSCVFAGSPPVFVAVPMSFELAAYAVVSGFMFKYFPKFIKENTHAEIFLRSYISLITAMIAGRIVYGLVMIKAIVLTPNYQEGAKYMIGAFWSDVVFTTWAGILIQLIVIPTIVYALFRAKLLPSYKVKIIKTKENE